MYGRAFGYKNSIRILTSEPILEYWSIDIKLVCDWWLTLFMTSYVDVICMCYIITTCIVPVGGDVNVQYAMMSKQCVTSWWYTLCVASCWRWLDIMVMSWRNNRPHMTCVCVYISCSFSHFGIKTCFVLRWATYLSHCLTIPGAVYSYQDTGGK